MRSFTGIVYKAINKINGKIYIGKTFGSLDRRLYMHCRSKNGIFSKALRKYGVQSFELAIIDTAGSNAVLSEKEIYWIAYYQCKVPGGYNLTDGGEGMRGHRPSESTRKKMSESSKGKNMGERNGMFGKPSHRRGISLSEITKQKIRIKMSGENNPNFGRRKSEETKEKLRNALKGRVFSQETIEKLKLSHQGIKRSQDTLDRFSKSMKLVWENPDYKLRRKEKLTGEGNPFYGRKHSIETKKKIGDAFKGKPWSEARRMAQGRRQAREVSCAAC